MGAVLARRSVVLAIVLLAGCGSDADPPARAPAPEATPSRERAATPPPAATPTAPPRQPVQRARCAPDAANCAAVTGRVIYVEAVDPDGDGDAHFVLAGGNVTGPGLSVIDVERELRPRRLPKSGELVSAAGPVAVGSHGQRQIEAVEINYQRRR